MGTTPQLRTAFIRGLWGVPKPEAPTKFLRCRHSITPEVGAWREKLGMLPFTTYVFGKDNADFLRGVGIEPVILSDKPDAWDNVAHCFRHKIEIIRRSLDNHDRVVWLDWDCFPQFGSLPDDFWGRMAGELYRACLKMHKHWACPWRDGADARYLPSGGFIYVGDAATADQLIRCWEESGMPTNDEVAMGMLGDRLMGGWKGPEEYCRRFEPYCVSGNRAACCPVDIAAAKMVLFKHR